MKNIKNIMSDHWSLEGLDIEAKAATNTFPKDALETYSAFANTEGGLLILGIAEKDDTFEISGVSHPDKVLKEMFDLLNNPAKVSRNIVNNHHVSIDSIENKTIIILRIPRANPAYKPIYLNGNPYRSYFRYHSADKQCTPEDVQAMMRDASQETPDSNILLNYTISDLDSDAVKKYQSAFANLKPTHPFTQYSTEKFLEAIGALGYDRSSESAEQSSKLYLTLAGLLVFGKHSAITQYLPHYHVEYIDKTGANIEFDRWRDRLIYDGSWGEDNLYTFFNLVINKLFSTIRSDFQLSEDNISRLEDTPMKVALREALINTLIHADYKIPSDIKITRYSDRISFDNPGNLRISRQDYFSGGHSSPRNPKIEAIFRYVNLCERAGSGVPKILDAVNHYKLQKPVINLTPHSFELILWDSSIIENATDLNDSEEAVLAFALEKIALKKSDLMANLDLSYYQATKLLNSLIEKGYLEAIGKARSARYIVKESEDFSKYNLVNKMSTLIELFKNTSNP